MLFDPFWLALPRSRNLTQMRDAKQTRPFYLLKKLRVQVHQTTRRPIL